MAVSLKKGDKVSLEKSMKMALVGLGWKTDLDADASAFCIGANGLCSNDKDFVFYGNLTHPSGAVYSKGDARTGEARTPDDRESDDDRERDDEQIVVDFSKVPAYVEKIEIVVTIYDEYNEGLTFDKLGQSYVRLAKIDSADDEKGDTKIEYQLANEFAGYDAVLVAEIFRDGDQWKFGALGQGFNGGLAAACANFGIEVE